MVLNKANRVIAGIAFLVIPNLAQAQPDTLWAKTFGGTGNDGAYSVCQATDGGYILTGWYQSQLYLLKTDALGTETWSRIYGANPYDDEGNAVIQAADGGYVAAGCAKLSPDDWDVILAKTDAAGLPVWEKTFAYSQEDGGNSIVAASDGGYAIAGTINIPGNGQDLLLLKTDGDGNESWHRTYGETGTEYAYALITCSDGGYAIAGMNSNPTPLPGAYLVKTDASGNELWSKTYGGTGTSDDRAYTILETPDHGFILAGSNFYSLTEQDAWLIRTDSAGNELWNRTYGGSARDVFYSIAEAFEGGYLIAGLTYSTGAGESDLWIVKTDADGNELWAKTYGGATIDAARSIKRTSDQGYYIIAGYTNSFGAGDYDAWYMKFGEPSAVEEPPCEPVNELTIKVNPSANTARISFSLSEPDCVSLKAYDVSGKLVKTIRQGTMTDGDHILDWNTEGLGRGVYFIRLETATGAASTRIVKF